MLERIKDVGAMVRMTTVRLCRGSGALLRKGSILLAPAPDYQAVHAEAAAELAADAPAEAAAAAPRSLLRRICKGIFRSDNLYFSAALCYMELVFKTATIRTGFRLNLFFILFFCLSLAGILSLLSSICSAKVNRITRIVLLFLMMIPFGVEYFIFREYNIFYDVNTIINGAGGAATGFLDEIARLVFSFNGISLILLLAIPATGYIIFGKRFDKADSMNLVQRLSTGGAVVLCFLLGAGLVHFSSTYANSYSKEYSFPTAVSNFGLLTGLRLDIGHGSGGKGNGELEFEMEALPVVTTTTTAKTTKATTGPDDTGTTETTTTTFGKNQLDIDFAKMAEEEGGTWGSLSAYVASLPASSKNEYTGKFAGKNLIFLTAEAFTKEAIDPKLTPTLYRLATKGVQFKDYYQPASAGTTGGEFQNLFGLLPMQGGASFPCFSGGGNCGMTMTAKLNEQGYWGKAYHNNWYTFYSRNYTHPRLGFSEGFMGYGNGMEQYVKYEWPQSDEDMIKGTMEEYINEKHFNVYYMTVSGHSGYGYSNAAARRHWEDVENLDCSDMLKGYYGANIDLDKGLEALIKALEKKGIADDTVICLSADHFPYGLDDNAAFGQMTYLSELYGYNVSNFIDRDHNQAILWCGCLEDEDPIVIDSPTSSLDLLPTLLNLFGMEYDSRLLPGRDIFSDAEPLYFDRDYNWKTDLGYYLTATQTFYPKNSEEVPEDYVERIKSTVRNKITYCQGVINSNYFAHVLEPQT